MPLWHGRRPGAALGPPYPLGPAIAGIEWAPAASIVRRAPGSDCWPTTWCAGGSLATAYGDGQGFEPFAPAKLSLGFARVTGLPSDFTGVNVPAPTLERAGDGPAGPKASGIVEVGGVLHLLARNTGNARLATSADGGRTWLWCGWRFTEGFGCPTFLQFGRGYSGARDGFVYVYSPDAPGAYTAADRMALARAPKDRLLERDAWEFFAGRDARGSPIFSPDVARRAAVFESPGRCWRGGVSYDAGIRRYLWCQVLPGGDPRFAGGLGVYDAPEPWGPWTTVSFAERWDVAPGESASFPTAWMSEDGRALHLVFSGEDSFSVRKAELRLVTR